MTATRVRRDVILTHTTPPTLAVKEATSVIPIVFATAGDPVGSDIVASLARPGGNVTGLSSQGTDAVGKRLELLRAIMPALRRVAVLANVSSVFAALEKDEVLAVARTLDLEPAAFDIRRGEDIAPAFATPRGTC